LTVPNQKQTFEQTENQPMKMINLKLVMTLLVPAALLTLSSCSSTSQNSSNEATGNTAVTTDEGHAKIVLNSVTATATVESINATNREVVLRREDGSLTSYICGPDVRNFDQIEVGDRVNVTLADELAVALVEGSLPPATVQSTVVVRAPVGAKPGGKVMDTVGFTARVVTVDYEQRLVTLLMPDGHNKTVKVGPDINLAKVNPGDNVGVRLTRAMILTVGKP
jgi:hypothetical protein